MQEKVTFSLYCEIFKGIVNESWICDKYKPIDKAEKEKEQIEEEKEHAVIYGRLFAIEKKIIEKFG